LVAPADQAPYFSTPGCEPRPHRCLSAVYLKTLSVAEWWNDDEWGRIWKEAVVADFRVLPRNFPGGKPQKALVIVNVLAVVRTGYDSEALPPEATFRWLDRTDETKWMENPVKSEANRYHSGI
jgi:hypothetical protein